MTPRVRIVSADQAANLQEMAEQQTELERLLAENGGTCCGTGPRMLDDLDREMRQAGEESQNPGDWGSA